jgi:hypothetical protein
LSGNNIVHKQSRYSSPVSGTAGDRQGHRAGSAGTRGAYVDERSIHKRSGVHPTDFEPNSNTGTRFRVYAQRSTTVEVDFEMVREHTDDMARGGA